MKSSTCNSATKQPDAFSLSDQSKPSSDLNQTSNPSPCSPLCHHHAAAIFPAATNHRRCSSSPSLMRRRIPQQPKLLLQLQFLFCPVAAAPPRQFRCPVLAAPISSRGASNRPRSKPIRHSAHSPIPEISSCPLPRSSPSSLCPVPSQKPSPSPTTPEGTQPLLPVQPH